MPILKTVKVNQIIKVNESYYILWIKDPEIADMSVPGQFFQIKPLNAPETQLKIPISVYDCVNGYIGFMFKILGKKTTLLSKLKKGDCLTLIGSIGKPFPLVERKNIVLLSGGIGYPPLWFLRKKLRESQNSIHWLHGGKTKDDIFPADELWSDDGSYGCKGFVTIGLEQYLIKNKPDLIYACGPLSMLKTCASIAQANEVKLYVSMEAYMACGIGVCYGCSIPCKSQNSILSYQRVCKDGAVFDAAEVHWDML